MITKKDVENAKKYAKEALEMAERIMKELGELHDTIQVPIERQRDVEKAEKLAEETRKMAELVTGALESINVSIPDPRNEEIKIQCLQLACSVLGVYGTASYTIAGESSKPKCTEVLDEAQKFYDWVSKE